VEAKTRQQARPCFLENRAHDLVEGGEANVRKFKTAVFHDILQASLVSAAWKLFALFQYYQVHTLLRCKWLEMEICRMQEFPQVYCWEELVQRYVVGRFYVLRQIDIGSGMAGCD
jgi:hypothetical protein